MGRLARILSSSTGLAAVVQTGLATVLVLGVNVVTGAVSARALGAPGRGELSALLLCPQFLCFLFTLGLPAAIIVTVKDAPGRATRLMGAGLLLSALMGLVAVTVGYFALPYLMRQYGPAALAAARGLLVLVVPGVTSTVLMAALQLRGRFVAYNQIRFWQSVLTLLSLLVLATLHAFRPLTAALAYVLPTVPFFIWSCWWVAREFRPRLHSWQAHARELLSYGWRAHVTDVGTTLLGQIDKIILVALLAPSAFGIYAVVFNLSRLVTAFASSATPVLLPRSAGQGPAQVLEMTSRAFTLTAALSFTAVLGFVILGGLTLRILYGPQFISGYWVLIILSVEGALSGGAAVLQQSYMVLHRPGTVALFQCVSIAAAATLVFALTSKFGLEGAAVGLLVGTALRFALTYAGYGWQLRIAAPRLVPTRADLATLVNRARASFA